MSTTEQAKGEFIAIDYKGFVGAAPGQGRVSHTRMPYIFQWPEDGVEELILYPGLNVIRREQWALYKSRVKKVATQIETRAMREVDDLSSYDDHDLLNEENGLIQRTVSHEGLAWIATQDERKVVQEAVATRLQFARPLKIEPQAYAEFSFHHQGKQNAKPIAPTASMG